MKRKIAYFLLSDQQALTNTPNMSILFTDLLAFNCKYHAIICSIRILGCFCGFHQSTSSCCQCFSQRNNGTRVMHQL